MKSLLPLYLLAARMFWIWASKEIHPAHPDSGKVALKRNHYEVPL